MEDLNKLLEGFKVLTTPYDKVDSRVITKKNVITALNQIGGSDAPGAGTGTDAPEAKTDAPGAGAEAKTDAPGAGAEAEAEAGAGAGAGADAGAGAKTEKTDEGSGIKPNPIDDTLGFLEKAKLKAARESEEDKGTTIPDGKEMMKKVIKIGAIIVYIMLLPLMPWYYIMKYSFKKLNILYKGVVKPL